MLLLIYSLARHVNNLTQFVLVQTTKEIHIPLTETKPGLPVTQDRQKNIHSNTIWYQSCTYQLIY